MMFSTTDGAHLTRRIFLAGVASLTGLGSVVCAAPLPRGGTGPASDPTVRLADVLRIVIPANPGGGWDQTGRALGAALVGSGAAAAVEYENVGGKGGTLGLEHFARKYRNDPNAVIIGGSVMLGGIALHKTPGGLSPLQPLARLTNDYLIVAVPASSTVQNCNDLVNRMKVELSSLPIAGGSAGGIDHIFSAIFVRAAKAKPEDLVYVPFSSGTEVAAALQHQKAAVGISGYGEFSNSLASGKLRAIGISARRSMFGIPSFRELGIDAVMANWRGVFTGSGVPAERAGQIVRALSAATRQESWQRTLQTQRWDPAWMAGPDFNSLVELDTATTSTMVYLLKLKS